MKTWRLAAILAVLTGAAGFAQGPNPEAKGATGPSPSELPAVNESARAIPVATNVDVIVVGGSSAAVTAAVAAKQAGASVFVLAPCPYLGEDLAGTMRLWLEKDEKPTGALAQSIFGTTGFSTPANLKKALDDALVTANIDFLYSCYATDLLTDSAGKPCGIVMANRAGRQAVIAKVIIDATENAVVARLAGAKFSPFAAGPQTVKWVTIAKQSRSDAKQIVRKLPLPVDDAFEKRGKIHFLGKEASWFEYILQLDLSDGSWAARAQLEQKARDLAYDVTQLYSSDTPFLVPADAITVSTPAPGVWLGVEQVALEVFRPAGMERLWILGGCAGLPRDQMEKLLRPVAFMEMGTRVGAAVATEAARISAPQGAHIVRTKATTAASGDTKECSFGLRPFPKPATIQQEEGALPILGSYDVVVVGGGTAGAPAGIGAARQGAKTLLIEYLHGLGGVGTLGMIGGYWGGNVVGFSKTLPTRPVETRMEWYRHELRQSHGDLWFGALGCGALVEGNRVTGVVVATPQGRGVVLAKVVIDGTGNSDIPIAAGADYVFVDDPNDVLAVQQTHLPPRNVGESMHNGDLPPIDDANPVGATRFFQRGLNTKSWDKTGLKKSFDIGQLIDSRERRRIVGDYFLDLLDILNKRTFPDSIEMGASDYDSHSKLNTHVFFRFRDRIPPHGPTLQCYVPYRCLLPKDLENVLVVGLGMSAHRDAMPIVRMQPSLQNQGYAAGVAAAMAVKAGVTPRQVDIKNLQRHLVTVGNLKSTDLAHTDSLPMPIEKIKEAAQNVVNEYKDLEILLAQPREAAPILRQAHESATGQNKIMYACVLGVIGDPAGVPTLLDAIKNGKGSEPLQSVNSRKPSFKLSEYELCIMALGYSRDVRAIPVLVELASQKQPLRITVETLGRIGDPAGAAPLAQYLTSIQQKSPANSTSNVLKFCLKDPDFLPVVCALWLCGDKDGLAKKALESIIAEDNGLHAELARKLLCRTRTTVK